MHPDEAAHAVNLKIAHVARTGNDGWRFDFLCECGCLEKVQLTVDEYAAAGEARAPGHGHAAAAAAFKAEP